MSIVFKGPKGPLVSVVCAAIMSISVTTSVAAQSNLKTYGQSRPLIVNNDRGGIVQKRVEQLKELRRSGRSVKITGRICYSTCTMFLGLPQTCISPRTTFGFHGPSSYGRTLDPGLFDLASRVISINYPKPLRSWYMQKGRYKIRRMYKVSGEQIIKMGVKAC